MSPALPFPAGGLISGFLQSCRRYPDRNALWVEGETYTYRDLAAKAAAIAGAIQERDDGCPLVAVVAQGSVTAYAGVLGVLAAGRGYVPLNPRHPLQRTSTILGLAGVGTVIAGHDDLPLLRDLLTETSPPYRVICPEPVSFGLEGHRLVPVPDAHGGHPQTPPPLPRVAVDDPAYVMFTSGSTGRPKGVPVSHGNALAYVHAAAAYYDVAPGDVLSQMFDMTFDLSVHDMFAGWQRGAMVARPPQGSLMAPARFIQEQEITMWFSVPSAAMVMDRLKLLKPGAFPSLRWSLFCGEPLPAHLAARWQAAAPRSVVENLYGPTEATVAISRYRWSSARSPAACANGIVPLGHIFPGQRGVVLGEDGAPAREGELYLGGTQVVQGYLHAPEKTASSFVSLGGQGEGWFRTGDWVQQDPDGCLHFRGRVDNQVKVLGHRVELEEIEGVARSAGVETAVAVAWPRRAGIAEGIVLFTEGEVDRGRLDTCCRQVLPAYQVPRRTVALERIPRNANGKVDRHALVEMLEADHDDCRQH